MVPDCFFVRKFGAVELDLNLCPVQFDISGDPEGNRIPFPFLLGDPFGYDLLELDSGIPFLIVQDFFIAEEDGLRQQFRKFLDPCLDPDFAVATLALGSFLNPEEGAKIVEVHSGYHVNLVVEDEAEPVLMGGGEGDVGGDQQVHHFGVPPSFFR